MKKVIKASKNDNKTIYWAEMHLRVAIGSNSEDEDEIAEEVFSAVEDALVLGNDDIKSYEFISIDEIYPDPYAYKWLPSEAE